MCKQLGISHAAYYKWLHRTIPEQESENTKLAELIKEYDERFGHILGYRRMTSWINHFNHTSYSKNRVHRIMKKLGIHSIIRKKKKKYQSSRPETTAENKLKREFNATKPNEKWATDVTEFKVPETGRKLYLSVIIDLYDRFPVAYVISGRNDNKLVFDTYDKALKTNPDAKPIFHSDRGFQYTSRIFQNKLREQGMEQSMSRVGHCIDNGPTEGLWGIIKSEMYCMYKITDEISLRSAIDKYIKFYAEERLQERFHCKTPLEVRSEALSAETPIQYPIAENKRIEAYKAKWCASSSLARQEREFARYDLDLSTKTMANWIINCADRYLKPLYQLMKEELLESRYIHCDESRIQVLGEPDQKGTTQNWMWVYLTDEFSGSPQMVLFDYERTRAGYHPVNFLGDRFHGYLTCDGYQAYHSLGEGIIVSGCLTHARRRFDAALTALKKDFTKEQLKETIAYQAMSRIGILYKIEEMIHNKAPEEKYEERQKQSRPVMDALFEWLHTMEDSVDRSSLIGDAILYTLNQEAYQKRYLEDGHLSIDNNSAERALKNFAVGRRNWLFAKSVRGAGASALVYSITETALLNHLKPYAYLTYILDELRKMGAFPKEEELKKLLPWSEDLPEYCRTKLKNNTKPSDIEFGRQPETVSDGFYKMSIYG